jgi:prepilin-type N-terminal cleavage/methylation domain-containing protein
MTMIPLRRRSSLAGFTLIELMISVALSTLVGILIYTVFIEQSKAYRVQADMSAMQQNLRVAMELITRDVATAGLGTGHDGGSWGADGQDGSSNKPIYGLRIRDNFPVGSGHDALEILMLDPDRSNWAYTDASVANTCSTNTIKFSTQDSIKAENYGASSPPFDRIMCYTTSGQLGRAQSFIWNVQGVGDGSTGIVPVTGNTQTDYANNCLNSLPAHMICGPPTWIAYYIDENSADGRGIGSAALPVLYLVPSVFAALDAGGYPADTDIPVALGIEDLQLVSCEAGIGIDCESSTSWGPSYDLDGTVSSNTWSNMSAVRVLLTARSLRPDVDRTSVSSRIDIEPSDTFAPVSGLDSYHRRVARTQVSVRNATGVWKQANQSF